MRLCTFLFAGCSLEELSLKALTAANNVELSPPLLKIGRGLNHNYALSAVIAV